MANVLKKIIINGVEYNLPTSGGGGGITASLSKGIADMEIKANDNVFSSTSWLYEILNACDPDDELGLTAGDTWDDIIEDATSMSLISHSYAVMVMLASSDVALAGVVTSTTALQELLECYNSTLVLFNSEKARDYIFNSIDAVTEILENEVDIDCLLNNSDCLNILTKATLDTTTWTAIFNNSSIAAAITTNTTYLTNLSKNKTAFDILLETTYWTNNIWSNITRLNIFMAVSYCRNAIFNKYTSSQLMADTPLRSIIQNNALQQYINKDETAYNSVIVFDITVTSSTTWFKIPRYGYWGSSYNWKYSTDGGAWNSLSGSASTSVAATINLAPGTHQIVLKPTSLGYNWARCLGNRNTTNYWTASPSTLKFTISNLPGYAFMSSSTDTSRTYFMAYNFYGCTSLERVKNFKIPSGTTAGNYYMSYTFYGCTNLTGFDNSKLLPTTMTTTGSYFMYYMFSGCTSLKRLPSGFNLSTITSAISSYFMAYFCNNCSKLEGLPTGMKLPPVGNSSSYMYYAFYGCTLLNSNSPTENLTFINAASYCFTNTGISTASPSAGSNIAVHRV